MQLVIFLPDLLNRLQLSRGNPTGLQVVALLDPVLHKETQILPLLDLTAAVAGILQQLLHPPSVTAVVRRYRCLGQATNPVINCHQPVLARSAASLDLNTILVLHFKTKIKIIYNVNNSLFVFRHCKITHKSKAKNQKKHVFQTPHEAHEEPPVIRTKHTKHGHKKAPNSNAT